MIEDRDRYPKTDVPPCDEWAAAFLQAAKDDPTLLESEARVSDWFAEAMDRWGNLCLSVEAGG